jgi:hypothetical protein
MKRKRIKSKYQPINDYGSEKIKIFFDADGFVLFPDGSRYKGGLKNGMP